MPHMLSLSLCAVADLFMGTVRRDRRLSDVTRLPLSYHGEKSVFSLYTDLVRGLGFSINH